MLPMRNIATTVHHSLNSQQKTRIFIKALTAWKSEHGVYLTTCNVHNSACMPIYFAYKVANVSKVKGFEIICVIFYNTYWKVVRCNSKATLPSLANALMKELRCRGATYTSWESNNSVYDNKLNCVTVGVIIAFLIPGLPVVFSKTGRLGGRRFQEI